MADYFPAIILIGGVLVEDQVTDLFEAAADDGVTTIDDGPIGDEAEFRALIDGAGPLILMDAQASYGKLPALETTCQDLGLSFRRNSDAGYEYEAEVVSWAPGMDHPRWTAGSQAGAAMIALNTVRGLLDAPAASDAELIVRLRAEIARHTPVDVPPLVIAGTTAGAGETAIGG